MIRQHTAAYRKRQPYVGPEPDRAFSDWRLTRDRGVTDQGRGDPDATVSNATPQPPP